jgi:hypothetical protein
MAIGKPGNEVHLCHPFRKSFLLRNTSFPPRTSKEWACTFRTNTIYRWSASAAVKSRRQRVIRTGPFHVDIGNVLTGAIGDRSYFGGGTKE